MGKEGLFFFLLQIAVETKTDESFCMSEQDWRYCYEQASRQSLLAVLFPTVQKYMIDGNGKYIKPLYNEWLVASWQTSETNKRLDQRAGELTGLFKSWGYRSCVLKGQGVARFYTVPELRQSGDIDLWVDGKQKDIVGCMRKHSVKINNIDYVHSGVSIFEDATVEVHFRPSWMYNPFTNLRLQRFFKDYAEEQFKNGGPNVEFAYPTVLFNLVFLLIHINRHIFEEGIGLRQLMDYFCILKHSTAEERSCAYFYLKRLRLKRFVGAVMYVLKEVFAINHQFLMCEPDYKEGVFLLEEIMRGGNFGHYDSRNEWYEKDQRIERGLFNAKRNLRYLRHYPSEVLWILPWKLWHWCWRKMNGYL